MSKATGQATANTDAHMSDEEVADDLAAFLDELVAEDTFSGAVLVARDGTPFFAQAYGLASHSFRVPNRLDTKFNLGSMNKMFTAVAIAQLAEQGKLAFDDTVGRHLSDYANADVAEKVTIHHLLTHTSGLGDYFTEEYERTSKERLKRIADYLPLFVEAPLLFEPGAQWRYSNAGFMLLGAIVERVTGQDYFDYVRERIYAPAGMINTDAYELDYDTPNLAIGYTGRPDATGRRQNNLFLHVVKGGPAGGGFSTVEDLLCFDRALRGHVLLSPESLNLVLTGKIPDGPDSQYAYGFSDARQHGTRIVGHGGGFPGINAQLDMYLELPYTVAVMSNYDPPAAMRVADRLRRRLTGTSVPVAVAVDAEILERHAGRYELRAEGQPTMTIDIFVDDDDLWLRAPRGDEHRLMALSETEFCDAAMVNIHLTFSHEDDGSSLTVSGTGPNFTARRVT